jgi:hypothetical protein
VDCVAPEAVLKWLLTYKMDLSKRFEIDDLFSPDAIKNLPNQPLTRTRRTNVSAQHLAS